jgi:hypothetical protein
VTSIVIPAHNEGQVIGRLLDSLLAEAAEGEMDIVVVCNGCTDDTAQVAALRGSAVRVVESPTPAKHAALRLGDEHALGFPRLYVDADVVLATSDVRKLTAPLTIRHERTPAIMATAPERDLPLGGCAWRVRAYYRVWQQLPSVHEGLFGRGVIAVSEAGYRRLAALPPLMADDLAASLAFTADEREVVRSARVIVHPPRTWPDLILRRIRAATSTTQLERHQRAVAETAPGGPETAPPPPSARTGKADLVALLRAQPGLLPAVTVFLAAAVIARRRSRKAVRTGDFGTWLRDESSRR